MALSRHWGHFEQGADMADKSRKRCPRYCTADHKRGIKRHSRRIAQVDLMDEFTDVAVTVGRLDDTDRIELSTARGWNEPTVAYMTMDEARSLRDALNVAVVLLDRT